MKSNILNDQIKKQIFGSVTIECSYTDVESESFEIYFRGDSVIIKAPFMRFKKLPDDLAAGLLSAAGIEFESNVRDFSIESGMTYDQFWNKYYNNNQEDCAETDELNALFNFLF